jgi:hypothetical protein
VRHHPHPLRRHHPPPRGLWGQRTTGVYVRLVSLAGDVTSLVERGEQARLVRQQALAFDPGDGSLSQRVSETSTGMDSITIVSYAQSTHNCLVLLLLSTVTKELRPSIYCSRSSVAAVLSMKSTISCVERQLAGCRILTSPHAAVSG